MIKRLSAVLVLSLALVGFAGCGSGPEKKSDAPAATTAAKVPCTKCKCDSWADPNGDGKCDTMVDGKPCDHGKADHKAP